MNDNLHVDGRLRAALHDLDHRIDQHLHAEPARTPTVPSATSPGRRRRVLVPVLAGFAVIALLITIGWLARPEPLSYPARPAVPSPAADAASQSPADAYRDSVAPALAQLPITQRLAVPEPFSNVSTTTVESPEGTWVISEPDLSTIDVDDSGCLAQKALDPYRDCYGYTEILLMTHNRDRIIKAFPIPDLPAQWLILTPDAIYCGRQGDGAIPDSMVCRIDRDRQQLTGRTFPLLDNPDPTAPKDYRGWPGTWTNNTPTNATGFDQAKLVGNALQIQNYQGKTQLTLDPRTLQPVS